MTDITLRSVKGTPLTHAEVDANFTNLKTTADAADTNASQALSQKANASSLGVAAGAADMGTYAGTTIPDSETAKQNIQSLETAVETKANASALGVTSAATNMGTFTGATIPDSQTGKQALQALETAHETLASDLASTASGKGAGLVGYLYSSTYLAGTVGAKLQQSVDLDDFAGATDHAKLSAGVAFCKTTGMALNMPSRRIDIDSDLGSITLEEVSLIGEYVLDGATGTLDKGAIIWITGTTNSPFKVRRGTSVNGLGFYYPNQTDSATPTAYPPIFAFDFTNGAVQFVFIRNNVVYNAYKFADIDDSAGAVGHIWIENNTIGALNRGIYLRRNLEHLRIAGNNFTFGHWLAATEAGARAYVRANATYVEVAESDGVEIFDNLFFGSLNAIKTSGTGLCQFMLVEQNKFDQVRRGVLATGSGRFDGSIVNNTFNCFNGQDTTLQGRSIDIQTTGAGRESITISANSFLVATEDHIFVSGNTPTRDIVIGPNNYRAWAAYKAAGSYGAVNASGTNTNVTVSGGWFMGGDSAAYSNGIMGSPNTLQCTGAGFNGCLAPINATTNTAILSGNVSYSTNGATSDVLTATNIWQTGNKWDKPSGSSTKPAFLVKNASAVTFNSGTATDMTWDSEVMDKGANFASPTFTAPYKGRYRFDWQITHNNAGTAGDRWDILLVTSAGTFIYTYIMTNNYQAVSSSILVELAVGGTAKIQVQRVGGAGNFVTHTDGNYTYFSGAMVE
jgi:hypothetical protein